MAKRRNGQRKRQPDKAPNPDFLRIGAAAVAAAIAAMLVMAPPDYPPGIAVALWVSAVVAGLVAGLSTPQGEWWLSPAVAAAACLVGELAMLGVHGFDPAATLVASVPLAAAVAAGMSWLRDNVDSRVAPIVALVVVLAVGLWSFGILPGPYATAHETFVGELSVPVAAETYGFDGSIYQRTFQLMNEGTPYYEAFGRAFMDDGRIDVLPPGPLNYREPLLFWIWALLPGVNVGADLLRVLEFLMLLLMAGVWFFARQFVDDGAALIAPVAIATLGGFYVTMPPSWFTFPELWASGVMVLALLLLMRKRWWEAAAALVVAVAIRELMVIFIPTWLVASALTKERRMALLASGSAIVVSVAVVAAHLAAAPSAGPAGSLAASAKTWLQSTGLPRLQEALQFGFPLIAIGAIGGTLLFVLALAGAAQVRSNWRRWALVTALVIPALFLTTFSSGPYDYYWGAILSAPVAAIAPLAFTRLLPRATAVQDA